MKRNTVLTVLFTGIIMAGFVWLLSQAYLYSTGNLETSYLQNWKAVEHYDNVYVNLVEGVKTRTENIANNCMPFYEQVLVGEGNINFAADYKLYSVLFGNMEQWYVPVGKDDYDYKFVSGDMSTLINAYRVKNYAMLPNMSTTQEFFKALRESNKDVNLYVYGCNVYDTSDLPDSSNLGLKGRGDYLKSFGQYLDANDIGYDYLKYDSMEEYKKYFFKTDHHWTIQGAYEGYKDVINMISARSPEIGTPRAGEFFKVEGVKFRGSIARISSFEKLYDELWDIKMDIPDYTLTIGGNPVYDDYSKKEEYLAGDFELDTFNNSYADYFHTDTGNAEYDFGNNTGRNLLMFVDSFSNCIDPYIASHYDKTYLVDLRYDEYANGVFNYNEFIEAHDIDDVVFMMYSDTLLFDNNQGNYKTKINIGG